jgi:histidyl-tRNA synthetase
MADLPLPRGVRDLMPNEALFRNEMLKKIEKVYQSFGFLTIDTPTFESLEVLKAKNAIGEESKLIYEMKDDKIGLRYDHTISLARYYSMHQDLPLPFKRYFIGKNWRKEEPQKNRYREFVQADVDILGGKPIHTDAEAIAAASKGFEALGVEYEIKINDRRFVDLILEKLGVKGEQLKPVYRAIDKLDKLEVSEVAKQLIGIGLSEKQVDELVGIIDLKGPNEEKLDFIAAYEKDRAVIKEFAELLNVLKMYNLKGTVTVDFSLVRGIDYYTSTAFEFKSTKKGMKRSIGSGGRYDNLIELYSGKKVAAIGASIGVDVVGNEILDYSSAKQYTYAQVMVNYLKDSNFPYALKVANSLREAGINTDINLASRNLGNQLAYANSIGVPYAIIIGDSEEKAKKLKIKNLTTGEEKTANTEEAIGNILG